MAFRERDRQLQAFRWKNPKIVDHARSVFSGASIIPCTKEQEHKNDFAAEESPLPMPMLAHVGR